MNRFRHGGPAVSSHLRQHLHEYFEKVDKSQIPDVHTWVKSLGGYFKRHRGGVLTKWLVDTPEEMDNTPLLDLEARATLAFLEVSFSCP